jgi:hypothetical protein
VVVYLLQISIRRATLSNSNFIPTPLTATPLLEKLFTSEDLRCGNYSRNPRNLKRSNPSILTRTGNIPVEGRQVAYVPPTNCSRIAKKHASSHEDSDRGTGCR